MSALLVGGAMTMNMTFGLGLHILMEAKVVPMYASFPVTKLSLIIL